MALMHCTGRGNGIRGAAESQKDEQLAHGSRYNTVTAFEER